MENDITTNRITVLGEKNRNGVYPQVDYYQSVFNEMVRQRQALESIRGMLQFFVILTVLGIGLSILTMCAGLIGL